MSVRFTFRQFSRRLSRSLFAMIFALVAPVHRPEGVASPAVSGNSSLSNGEAESRYQICLKNSRLEFSREELSFLARARVELEKRVAPYRASNDKRMKEAYRDGLGAFISSVSRGAQSSGTSPRVLERIDAMMIEERFVRDVMSGPGLNGRRLRLLKDTYSAAVYEQRVIDLNGLARLHEELVRDLISHEQSAVDQSLGLAVPMALAPQNSERLHRAILALNVMMDRILRSQVENHAISEDRARYARARIRQAAFAMGGVAVLVATIKLGPPMVVGGGSLANSLGVSALVGEVSAGMSIGSVGGAAAEGVKMAYEITSQAYFRSLEKATPLRCELERAMLMFDQNTALLRGAAFGMTAGSFGTVVANLVPKVTLWLLGGAVVVGQANELGQLSYYAFKAYESYELAGKLADLRGVPESMKAEQLALIKEALSESHQQAQKAGQHAVASLIVGILAKAFFVDGEFRLALEHGKQMIKSLTAYSADTVPSVVMAAADAVESSVDRLSGVPNTKLVPADLKRAVGKFVSQLPQPQDAYFTHLKSGVPVEIEILAKKP